MQGVSRDDYVLVASRSGSGLTSVDDLSSATEKRYGTTGVGTGAQLACALTYGVNVDPGRGRSPSTAAPRR